MPTYKPLVGVMITLSPDPKPVLDGYSELVRDFDILVGDVVQTAYADAAPILEDQLRFTPPMRVFPQDYPIIWSDDPAKAPRVRAAAMAKIRAVGGPPYPRTGALAKAWFTGIERALRSTTIRVTNSSPVGRFIFGVFSGMALKIQQPMHRNRWPLAAPITNLWFTLLAKEVNRRLRLEVRRRVKGRATFRTTKVYGGQR